MSSSEDTPARKRVVRRKTAEATAPKRVTPRRTSTTRGRTRIMETAEDAPSPSPARRAPVALPTISASRRSTSTSTGIFVVGTITLLSIAGGVWVGLTDSGKIDVTAIINEQNERMNRGEGSNSDVTQGNIPVARPNLRPADEQPNLTMPVVPLPIEALAPEIDTNETSAGKPISESATSSVFDNTVDSDTP